PHSTRRPSRQYRERVYQRRASHATTLVVIIDMTQVSPAEWPSPVLELPICEGVMHRMDVAWWCRVADALSEVNAIQPGTPFASAYSTLKQAIQLVITSYSEITLVRLTVSQPSAFALFQAAHPIISDASRQDPVTVEEVARLQRTVADYRTILHAELGAIDAY